MNTQERINKAQERTINAQERIISAQERIIKAEKKQKLAFVTIVIAGILNIILFIIFLLTK